MIAAVVPAKAGTHNLNCITSREDIIVRHGVWVPAFAGTTRTCLL